MKKKNIIILILILILLVFIIKGLFYYNIKLKLKFKDKINIMFVGDSITAEGGKRGYRYYVWEKLIENKYDNLNLVGSQEDVINEEGFDKDHEGHDQWTVGDFLYGCSKNKHLSPENRLPGDIKQWNEKYKPDIVLIYLGINDYYNKRYIQSQKSIKQYAEDEGLTDEELEEVIKDLREMYNNTIDENYVVERQEEDKNVNYNLILKGTIKEMEGIIDVLREENSNIVIIIAQITAMTGIHTEITEYNQEIIKLVERKNKISSPVLTVDLYTGFDHDKYTKDSIHPTEEGAKIIGEKWYNELVKILPS